MSRQVRSCEYTEPDDGDIYLAASGSVASGRRHRRARIRIVRKRDPDLTTCDGDERLGRTRGRSVLSNLVADRAEGTLHGYCPPAIRSDACRVLRSDVVVDSS